MRRPRLTPEMAKLRRAVTDALNLVSSKSEDHSPRSEKPLLLVGLSGGADSLALAAAVAFAAPRNGYRAGAVIVNHQLQDGSDAVALEAAAAATALGLDPVLIETVTVDHNSKDGIEAAARKQRYAAFERVLTKHEASRILLAHTLDDQAETVLLGLIRGSGPKSLHGMTMDTGRYLRPFLPVRRSDTVQACQDQDLTYWSDPHNDDETFRRVAIRKRVLPFLQQELGNHIPEALAKTAEILQEDSEYLEELAEAAFRSVATVDSEEVLFSVSKLQALPTALRNRVIRFAAWQYFSVTLTRDHTLQVFVLVDDWRGQQRIELPKLTVTRTKDTLRMRRHRA